MMDMSIKNKWKKTFFKKLFFLVIVFSVSAGIRVQAAEDETRKVILETETDNMVEVRSVDIEGFGSQYTILNEEDVRITKDEIEKPVLEEKYSEKGAAQNTEITLYVLEQDYQQYISIPDGYLQSYSLSGHTYGAVNGSSVTILGGKIVPAIEIRYYHKIPDSIYWVSQTSPSGQEGEIVKERYIYEDSSIVIDGKTVIFHVCDYAQIYSEQIMNQYLNENTNSSMTDYEKAEICCQFAAGYDYGTESSSYTGMIVTGSGDCWASTDTLLYMLDKLEIKAQSRWDGNTHYNVLAILDGYYYVLDAGYFGKAPRIYSMKRFSSSNMPYVYSVISEEEKTICITDYYEYDETVIQIPSVIDGYTVTKIGDKAFYNTQMAERIVIPDTVKIIGDSAFGRCQQLKMIDLPDSVVSLGKAVFYNDSSLSSICIPASVEKLTGGMFQSCDSLKKIIVDEENKYYCSQDGVLFDKSMTILIAYPPGKSDAEYNVPEGVTAIGGWAFVSCGQYVTESSSVINNGFRKLVLPKSLRTIEESAFLDIYIEEMQIQEGITAISSYTFKYSRIDKVTLPDSVTVIEPYAFYRASLKEIVLSNALETIGKAAFAGNLRMKAVLPESVREIGYGAFWLNYGWSSMDATENENEYEFDNTYNGYIVCNRNCNPKMEERAFYGPVSIGAVPGSFMQSYAAENGIYYVDVDSNLKCTLKQEWLSFAYPYSMTNILNTVFDGMQKGMTAAPYLLIQGEDYTLNYDPENFIAYVKGIGYMTGNVTMSRFGDIGDLRTEPAKGTVLKSGKNSYKVTKKGSAAAFAKTSSNAKSITIPAAVKINGITYKVTSIAANALKNNKKITKITIGSNVKSIGKNAFRDCRKLKSIMIRSEKITSVGGNAFKGMKSNAKIKTPASKLSDYKKLFKRKGLGRKVKITN